MFDEDDKEADKTRYKVARDGDHLMMCFQCDGCHFRNVQGRDPQGSAEDDLLLLAIRRATLDSFWSREASTVEGNLREGRRIDRVAAQLGIEDPYGVPRGPFPLADTWGMRAACASLVRSLDPGINAATIQHGTMRKMRSHYSNYMHTTPGALGAASLAAEKKSTQRFTTSMTYGLWYSRWDEGCHTRMGDVWLPDRAMTIDVLLKLQELWEDDYNSPNKTEQEKLQVALVAMAAICGFSGALRGDEIPKADLGKIREFLMESLQNPRKPHVTMVLHGRFKGFKIDRDYLLPLAPETKSGLKNRVWLCRVVLGYQKLGVTEGPVFRLEGEQLTKARVRDLDAMLHEALERLQQKWPNLIPASVNIKDFSFDRSFRRGATAEAQNQHIPEEVINANNRWRASEGAKGGKVAKGGNMMQYYTEVRAAIVSLLRFSESL
jgi:hypothetical protein